MPHKTMKLGTYYVTHKDNKKPKNTIEKKKKQVNPLKLKDQIANKKYICLILFTHLKIKNM